MATLLFGAGLVLALALLIAINHRLARLVPRLSAIVRAERAHDDARSLTALQEAAAAKVGLVTVSLRRYEEQVAEAFRAQVAEAETRARMVERQSADAGIALSAAAELVRELRALLDGAGARRDQPAAEPDDARRTLKLGAPPGNADDEPDEEPTKVGKPPATGAAPAQHGLRLAPRGATPAASTGEKR